MKTMLSFGLIVAAASALIACSDEGGTDRNNGGTGGGNNAGTGGQTAGGTGGQTSGGTGGQNTGGTGGGGSDVTTGDALTIGEVDPANDNAPVESAEVGINGGAYPVTSPMNPAVTFTTANNGLCFQGETAQVVNMDYDNYWGAGIYVDLNRVASGGGGADAGADAGDAGPVLGTTAQPWDPTTPNPDVIGFSFTLVGQDSAIMDNGVPPEMRFQARPGGSPEGDTSACVNIQGAKHNVRQNVLFDNMLFQCYNATASQGLFEEPLTPGYQKTLLNIGFQVNASTALAYQFNFCVTDIRPILAE